MPGTRDDYILAMASLGTGWYRAKVASITSPLIGREDIEDWLLLGAMARRLSGYTPPPPMGTIQPGGSVSLTMPNDTQPAAAEAPAEAPQS